MRKIEVSQNGDLLIFQKSYTPEFVFETIQKHHLKGLRIFAHLRDQRIADISFLGEYSFLQALDITSLDDYDFSFLRRLDKLKKLSIYTEGKNEIDLSNQTNLEYLAIQWRHGKIKGIEYCKKLTSVGLVEYKEEDLLPISNLSQLRNLRVKTSSIRTLAGLENIKALESLLLGNCRSLRAIKALNGLRNLKSLEINVCSKIQDYESLTDLPNLESLSIIDCRDIKSIKFIERFPSLKKVALVGNTNVVNGDLMPAKHIKEHVFPARRHYNVTMDRPK